MRQVDASALRVDADADDLPEIEIKLLLEGVYLRYGYDFRDYSLSPLRRSLDAAMVREGVSTVSTYQDRVLRDPGCMQRFLNAVGVNVTSLFREPELMSCIRSEVVPIFRTYPSIRIWIAGCATGEDAYSMAVVLREANLLRRASIYATDINEQLLAAGRLGTYPADRYRRYVEAYQAAGGSGNLSDHCSISGSRLQFDQEILSSITWARHNLVSDGSFNDFHLIVCTNVLIYFGRSLQERAHRLFYDSLVRAGYFGIGRRESLLHCPDRDHYEPVQEGVSLFRKMRW